MSIASPKPAVLNNTANNNAITPAGPSSSTTPSTPTSMAMSPVKKETKTPTTVTTTPKSSTTNGTSSKSSSTPSVVKKEVKKEIPAQSTPTSASASSSIPKRKSRVLHSSDDEDEDDKPLAKKAADNARSSTTTNGQASSSSSPVVKKAPEDASALPTPPPSKRKSTPADSDDDVPLAKKAKNQQQQKKPSTVVVKQEPKASSTSDSPKVKVEKSEKRHSEVKQEKSEKKHSEVKQEKSEKKHSEVKHEKSEKKPDKEKKPEVKNEKSTPPSSRAPSTSKASSASPSKKTDTKSSGSPVKRARVKKEEEDVWRWWEEEKYTDGRKWTTLEHKGPLFAPPYEPLPQTVKFFYNGAEVKLKEPAEEIMTFYAKMLDHDYTKKDTFNTNFMTDWRKSMSTAERELIKDIRKCDFTQVAAYFKEQTELRKAMSKEDKKQLKEDNEKIRKEYGFCMWDTHRQPVGNYKIEPPGLFRGRGEHPKMGCVKKRIRPEDVIINIGRDAHAPKAPEGHRWKEIRHDNKVSWLVMWTENIRGNNKYIMLNASSRVKGERDWQKYEKARKLHRMIDKIREEYQADWKSKEMRIRQRAVALYFIDKLALRVGNEKDEDEADTVGCCSLRIEHINLFDNLPVVGDNVVEFDFLGKDSIRYNNKVSVEPRVYKNLKLFIENKEDSDDLFDRLSTTGLNQYLSELMEGLTAKVFRTYNASKTLQDQLDMLTVASASVPEKILAYNRANRQVAILCNHQRSVPKTFEKSQEKLVAKIDAKKGEIEEMRAEFKRAKADHKNSRSQAAQKKMEQAEGKLKRGEEALKKLELNAVDRDENKDIALGTSKLNYLDPRISVAWCKKWNVPIEKIYSKTQRDKFRWAIDMATAEYHFYNYEGEIVLRNVDETKNGEEDEEDEDQGSEDND